MAVAVNGDTRVHYVDHGGDGPAVVFSHGFLMDHEMFAAQIDTVRKTHRCIAWDQRGFGGTEPHGTFTFWDSADDLLAVMDACGVDSALHVGMSQGGFVGLRAALTAPDRLGAQFLIGTQAETEDEQMMSIYEGMAQAWAAQPTEDLARSVASIIIGEVGAEPWVEKWLARPGGAITEPFRTLLDRDDLHEQLPQIAQPVAIVHGAQDVAISLDKAERLCRELPNCEGLTVIEGAGHAANLNQPEKVNELLGEFLARHSG